MTALLNIGAGLSRDEIIGQALSELSSAMIITYQTEEIKDSREFKTAESVFDFVLGDCLSMAQWRFLCVYKYPREYKTSQNIRNSHTQEYSYSSGACCGSCGCDPCCCGGVNPQDIRQVQPPPNNSRPAPVFHTHCCDNIVIRFRDEELRLLPYYFIKLLITKMVIKLAVSLKGDLNIRRYYEERVLRSHLAEALLADRRSVKRSGCCGCD